MPSRTCSDLWISMSVSAASVALAEGKQLSQYGSRFGVPAKSLGKMINTLYEVDERDIVRARSEAACLRGVHRTAENATETHVLKLNLDRNVR